MDFGTLQNLVVAYGVRILIAILIFIVGKWLVKKATDLFVLVMTRKEVDVTLITFLKNIIYYMAIVMVLICVAAQLGMNVASFITVFGAAALAVGLALKDSMANFASGIMLIIFRPFSIGDLITAAGETGIVQEINIFHTIIHTGDNQKKIIPNGAISNATVTNVKANPTRRIDLVIGIGYDDDIRLAKRTLEEILAAESRVLKDPAPTIGVLELADSSVNLAVRPWVKTEDYWNVHFALLEQIKLTFDEKGILIPYPQQDIHLYQETE